ncbi:hypothetical protein [Amycolatopsis sp. NPDC051716]|uniref:helix-turn-helix transcriptional regulator n=1 Tax=Amycolatopsis sp. NPDC051716 TaxID=3155804 RepID=UPI00341A58D2
MEHALDKAQQMLDVASSTFHAQRKNPSQAAAFYSSEDKLEPILDWFVRRSHSRPVRLYAVWDRRPKLELRPALLRRLGPRSPGWTAQVLSPPGAISAPEAATCLDGPDDRLQVRVSRRELPDLTILDREVAILRTTTSYGQPRIFAVHNREIVRGFCALYDAVWAEAVELQEFRTHGIEPGDELTSKVLGLLSDGYKDEAAARQLGLSVRTYRRHVADLMARLDVTCRFQAGVQAVRLGLIGDHSDSGAGQPL